MPSVILAGTTLGTSLSLTGDTSGELQIQTNNGATTAMTLTTAGNVGIGTSSPDNALTIQDAGAGVNKRFSIRNGDSTNNHKLIMGYNVGALSGFIPSTSVFISGETNGGYGTLTSLAIGTVSATPIILGTSNAERMRIDSAGNVIVAGTAATNTNAGRGNITLNGTSSAIISIGTGGAERGYIFTQGTDFIFNATTGGLALQTQTATPMTFLTNNTERMRIDSSGNLLVGYTDGGGNVGSIGAIGNFVGRAGVGGAVSNRFAINWVGVPQLWIDTTNVGTLAYTSDYRVKRNIETQTAPALERVMALRPVTYQMTAYGDLFKSGDDIKEGFIAHEVQEVIPSGVDGVKDDPVQIQSLRVDAILAVAVKAIQELKAELDSVKAELQTLKGK